MRKRILIALLIGFAALTLSINHSTAQWMPYQKTLTKGDTTYRVNMGLDAGKWRMWKVSLKNSGITYTDSVKIYHITKFSKTDSAVNQVGYKKYLNGSTQVIQNDTLYYLIILAPGESIDILVWYPYPEIPYFVMVNTQYVTRSLKVRNVMYNY